MKTPGKLFEKSVLRGLQSHQPDNSDSAVQERRGALSDLVDNMMLENGILPMDGNDLPPAQNDAETKILKIFNQMSAPSKGTGVLYSRKEMKSNLKKMAQMQGELFYILDTQQISQPYSRFGITIFTSLITSYDLANDRNHLMTSTLDNFSLPQQAAYFSLLYKAGYSDEFEEEIATKLIPLKIRNLYKKWKDRNAGRLDEIKNSLVNQQIDQQLEKLQKEVAVEDVLAGEANPHIPAELTKEALEEAIAVATMKYELYTRCITPSYSTKERTDALGQLLNLISLHQEDVGPPRDQKFATLFNVIKDEFFGSDNTLAWEEAWLNTKNKNRFSSIYGQMFTLVDTHEVSVNHRIIMQSWISSFIGNIDDKYIGYRKAKGDFFDHLNLPQQNALFSLIHKFDMDEGIRMLIDNNSIPMKIRKAYKKWEARNADKLEHHEKFDIKGDLARQIEGMKLGYDKYFGKKPAEEQLAEQIEELKQDIKEIVGDDPVEEHPLVTFSEDPLPDETPEGPVSALTIIELEHPVVLEGESDEMLAVIQGEDALKGPLSHVKHDKRSMMLTLLEKSGIPMSACTLYKQKGVQGSDTDRYPYEVLEINHDRLHALALICNWTNFATFHIRDPKDFDGSEPIVLSDVRDMDNAWRVIHRSPAQWDQDTYKTLFTPIRLLPVQLKHIIAWGDQRDNLIESFGATIAATGRIPTSTDDSIVGFGPLAGKTTWSRAYRAVNKGSIAGLEDVKNFHQLYDHASANDARLPNFMGRKPLPDARAIFMESVRFSRETGFPPQKLLFGDLRCFDRPAQHISDAFSLGAIRDWEHFVEDPTLKPTSLDEFIVSTGLAKWQGNVLELAGDVEQLSADINQRYKSRAGGPPDRDGGP